MSYDIAYRETLVDTASPMLSHRNTKEFTKVSYWELRQCYLLRAAHPVAEPQPRTFNA